MVAGRGFEPLLADHESTVLPGYTTPQVVAELTGFEPASSSVTGRHPRPLDHSSVLLCTLPQGLAHAKRTGGSNATFCFAASTPTSAKRPLFVVHSAGVVQSSCLNVYTTRLGFEPNSLGSHKRRACSHYTTGFTSRAG